MLVESLTLPWQCVDPFVGANLVALNAKTGKRYSDFGENGQVDLTKDFGEPIGYLSRGDALDYGPVMQPLMSRSQSATCRAKLVVALQQRRTWGLLDGSAASYLSPRRALA